MSRKEINARYYEKHREELQLKRREYYKKHREVILNRAKAWNNRVKKEAELYRKEHKEDEKS